MKKPENTQKIHKSPIQKGNAQKTTNTNPIQPLFVAIAAAVAIFTFIMMQKFVPDSELLQQQDVSKGGFFFISLISSLIAFIGVLFNTQSWAKNVSKYTTLLLIIFQILQPFLSNCVYLKPDIDKYAYLALYLTFSVVPIIVLGAISLYQYRENIATVIHTDHKEDQCNTEEKKTIFSSFLKWCKSEGWFQLTAFFFIVLIAGTIFFYRLDYFHIYDDEYSNSNVAEGYMNTGKFVWWDYFGKKDVGVCTEENRFQIWLVAQSYKFLGVNEFAMRLPSAIFGLIYMFFVYLVGRFFTRDKLASLLLVVLCMLDTEMIHFFRYCRTYAVFIPFFLLFFYVFYRAVAEERQYSNGHKIIKFVNTNFNYNLIMLLFAFILIPVLFSMKNTALVLLPAVFLFILIHAVIERKKRYLIASALGLVACFIVYFGFSIYLSTGLLSFFDSPMAEQNKVYLDVLTQYPVSKAFFIAMAGLGLVMILVSKDAVFRRKLVYFYSVLLTVAVFFVYVINYQGIGSRYIYHAVPIVTLFVVCILFTFLKPLFHKIVSFGVGLLLVLGALNVYSNQFEGIYLKNARGYGQTQKAYDILMKKLKPDEVVFFRYFRSYHLRNYTGKMPQLVEMAKEATQFQKNSYNIDNFLTDLKQHKKGWVIWQTYFYSETDPEVMQYINLYFKKMSGNGIDDSKTELFYFDESMIVGKAVFEQDKNFPVANLDLSKPYSLAFWFNSSVPNSPAPVLLGKDANNGIGIESNNTGGYKFIYTPNSQELTTGNMSPLQWHHIVWTQEGGAKGQRYSLYVDGVLKENKTLTQEKLQQVKFSINRYFNGKIQDIRLYDSELTKAQIEVIYNNGNFNLEGVLFVKHERFEPFGHWTIKQ